VLAGVVVLCTAPPSFAYRPFDGTDAAVAGRGELEIELGPAGLLRLGPDRFLVAPALIANFGLADRWELVLEGRQHVLLGAAPDLPRSRIVDTALSLKTVLRVGELQEEAGPSVAAELGVLLPTLNDEPSVGAQGTLIVSRRFADLTAHVNAGVALSRDRHLELPGSLILEGPWRWTVRPVVELFSQFREPGQVVVSALGGIIWRTSGSLAIDVGLRAGRAAGQPLLEGRLGLTISLDLLAKT
jgi:hypothetical protein